MLTYVQFCQYSEGIFGADAVKCFIVDNLTFTKDAECRTGYRGNLKVDYSLCQSAALNMLTLTNSMRRGNTVPFTLNK